MAVPARQEKAAQKSRKLHFKVEQCALGLLAGPTKMENEVLKLCNDTRLWDSLELLTDFLQSGVDGSHVGYLAHHYKNWLKIAAGALRVMCPLRCLQKHPG